MLKLNIINDIIEDFKKAVKGKIFKLRDYLIKGNLKQFEEELNEEVTKLYNRLACVFIMEVAKSKELKEKAKIIGQKKGLKAIRQKTVKLQLKTGFKIKIFSWYAAKSSPKYYVKKIYHVEVVL